MAYLVLIARPVAHPSATAPAVDRSRAPASDAITSAAASVAAASAFARCASRIAAGAAARISAAIAPATVPAAARPAANTAATAAVDSAADQRRSGSRDPSCASAATDTAALAGDSIPNTESTRSTSWSGT
jgi:two-component system, chemotaxis family, sensor kinase CheA